MDIIESIDRFINARMYHYALLLNGKWGCGKTYFITETLIPHIRDLNLDVNYLSLYGVQSTEEISRLLCAQAIKDKIPALRSKAGEITTKLLSAAVRGGLNLSGLGDTGIESVAQMIPNYDNNVIIFDDLERCNCPINEVLGYINNFVEHSNAAVILVANEEEIGKCRLDDNQEMQILIAMDRRVDVKLPATMDDYFHKTEKDGFSTKERERFTPQEIEIRRRALFYSNDAYKAVKEKVIGMTITYDPDLKPIFQKLIAETSPALLRDRLEEQIDWLVSVAEKDNHKNLRTFQYFLEKVSIIFNVIQEKYQTLHQTIIRYTYRSCIRYMKGLSMPKWDADYGVQGFGEETFGLADQELGFRFIDELIQTNALNADYINEVLTNYARFAEMKGQLSNDPFQKINTWWQSEDEQVREWLKQIENNVSSGFYSTELYPELTRYMAELKAHGVMCAQCDSIFAAMQEHIHVMTSAENESFKREGFFLSGETGRMYKEMREQLQTAMEGAKAKEEKEKYEVAISDTEHWASNLVNASANSGTLVGHSFVYWLDPNLILSRILTSSVSELFQFRNALQCIYDSSVYYEHKCDDAEHLCMIRDGFTELDKSEWGEIKRASEQWIIADLDRYLERISPRKTPEKIYELHEDMPPQSVDETIP